VRYQTTYEELKPEMLDRDIDVIFQIKPGFKFQIIRNRFSGFYGTFCTLFKEKITDFAHNHFIPVCILRSKKMPWI
jgi:hypothetical protein